MKKKLKIYYEQVKIPDSDLRLIKAFEIIFKEVQRKHGQKAGQTGST